MKKLLLVTIVGAVGVLAIVVAGIAAFDISQGRPIAHANGMWAVLLRDTLLLIAVLLLATSVVAYWILTWYFPDNLIAHFVRHWVGSLRRK